MAVPIYFGTEGNDVIDQDALGLTEYTEFRPGGGDDTVRIRSGYVISSPGNDRIEVQGWPVALVFPDPAPVTVDLASGVVLDGYGGRDTVIGLAYQINSTGHDDKLYGNTLDNLFAPGGGRDLVDGREGLDRVVIYGLRNDFTVRVAIDGGSAMITHRLRPNDRLELANVEWLDIDDGAHLHTFWLADLINPMDQAVLGLTGAATQRWNAGAPLGSAVEVGYSFVASAPTSGLGAVGFRAFTSSEQAVVREILSATSAFSGIAFRELTDGSAVQMRFGISQQDTTKGISFAPDQPGASAGDVWMDADSMASLARGGEGYAALVHEIGHAIGLRHPRNAQGESYAAQLRTLDDHAGNTAMASAAAFGGLFRADWGPLDVAAIRSLYGARSVAMGDDTYRLGSDAGLALRTLIDDGGNDTLDASATTIGAEIDLRAARPSSIGRTAEGQAAIGNLALAVGTTIENAIGTPFDDVITGNDAANRIQGGLGNDLLHGGGGSDIAVYAALRGDYDVHRDSGVTGESWQVAHRGGTDGADLLDGIERLQFSDRWIALEIAGAPTQAVQALVGALFGKANLTPQYIGIGIALLEGGMTPTQLAALAVSTPIFAQLAGSHGNADFVRLVYRNVVGVAPSAPELASFQGLLDSGQMTQAELAVVAAQHPLNDLQIGLVGLADTGIEYLPG